MSSSSRIRRQEDMMRASELQVQAGLEGALRATAVGIGLAIIAHYSWKPFRRQTFAFKGLLVSGFSITGLVFGAERALFRYEAERRREENNIRRQARLDLARQGLIPTESAIAQWKADNDL